MKITADHIYRSLKNRLTDEEKAALDAWIGESEENARAYRDALVEYEYLLVNADLDTIRSVHPAAGTLRETQPAAQAPSASRRRILLRTLLGAAAVAAFFFLGVWISDLRTERKISESLVSATARPGQIVTMTLADGTSIDLNSGSTLSYPPVFGDRQRLVHLEGEAYFDVAHDGTPFIVRTFATDIEVLGTKFNVNADPSGNTFSVTLEEGSVRVVSRSDPDHPIELKPDERLCLQNGRLALEKISAKDDIRWKDGIIDIGGLGFADLMRKLEMAFGVTIVIDRDTMPELKFTDGRLRVSDGIDYAMKVLQNCSDFTWTKDYTTGTIHIR